MTSQAEPRPREAHEAHHESRVKVARNALDLVLGQVATTAIAVVLSAALGRNLGPADFGLYFLLFTTSQFAFVLVEWGQNLYGVREMSRNHEHTGRILGSALAMRLAGGLVIAGPVALATRAWGYDARTALFAGAFVIASLPFSVAQGFGMAFRSRERMGNDALVSVANKVVVLFLTLAALGLGTGIPGVMGAQFLAGFAAVAMALRLYRGLGAGPLEWHGETAHQIWLGGLPILVMLVTVTVQPYLDVLLLSKLAPPEVVGWYGAAKNIMGTLMSPSMILAGAWYPRLSRAAGDVPVFRRELRSAVRPMLWLGALGGVGTYLFADFAVGLIYGQQSFGPAAAVLRVFGVGLFLVFVDVLLGHVVTAVGKATGFAIAKATSVVVAVGLQLWLIPWFQVHHSNGGIGVVVAFAASEVIVFFGVLLLIPRGALGAVVLLDVARAAGAALATAVVWRVLPPLHPLVGIPLCVLVFAAASLAAGLLGRSDLALLLQTLRRKG